MQTDVIERKMLMPAEVAASLRVHVGTVYRAIERGELQAVRLGETGSLRVPADAVEQFLRPAHDDEGEHAHEISPPRKGEAGRPFNALLASQCSCHDPAGGEEQLAYLHQFAAVPRGAVTRCRFGERFLGRKSPLTPPVAISLPVGSLKKTPERS
jgi:excisionase family DNA binding protein